MEALETPGLFLVLVDNFINFLLILSIVKINLNNKAIK